MSVAGAHTPGRPGSRLRAMFDVSDIYEEVVRTLNSSIHGECALQVSSGEIIILCHALHSK